MISRIQIKKWTVNKFDGRRTDLYDMLFTSQLIILMYIVVFWCVFFPQFLQCDVSRLPLAWDCVEGGIWTLTPTWNWPLHPLLLPGYRASSAKVYAFVCVWITMTTRGGAAGSWWTWRRSQKQLGGDWGAGSLTPVHKVRVDSWEVILSTLFCGDCKYLLEGNWNLYFWLYFNFSFGRCVLSM